MRHAYAKITDINHRYVMFIIDCDTTVIARNWANGDGISTFYMKCNRQRHIVSTRKCNEELYTTDIEFVNFAICNY